MFMTDGMMFLGSWKDEHWAECPLCKWSGYKWRIGLFEMMDYNDDIKTLLLDWKSAFEIETYALQHGMINLERDWIFKIIQWVTTLEEVYSYVKTKIEI
jgi:type II secretory ATPase GspE/PulE/Tfp pilus assembly ATPase PilB-like protein